MDGDMRPDLGTSLIWLVADTFDVPSAGITLATRPDEVPGWDSLGHSVLLTRAARKYDLDMTEELAAPVGTVGEFAERIGALIGRPHHG
jgi:acyl carrier protein